MMRYWELGLQYHILLLLLLYNSTHNKGEVEENAQGWKSRGWDLRGASPLVRMARLKKVYHNQHTVSKATMAVSVLANWKGGSEQRKTLRET